MPLYDPLPGGGISMRPPFLTEDAGKVWVQDGDFVKLADDQSGAVSISEPQPVAKARAPRPKKVQPPDAPV